MLGPRDGMLFISLDTDAAELGFQSFSLSLRIREQPAADLQVCYPNLVVSHFINVETESFRTDFTGIYEKLRSKLVPRFR